MIMFGSFLPSLWSSTNHSLLGSKEPTLLCNQVEFDFSLYRTKQELAARPRFTISASLGSKHEFRGAISVPRLRHGNLVTLGNGEEGRVGFGSGAIQDR